MNFYDVLEEHDMAVLLSRVELEFPTFINTEKVEDVLLEILRSKQKVFVIGDCDVDGLMCTLGLRDGLHLLGVKDVDVFPYRSRMHTIDPVAVQKCIQGGYKYCIIADCGSNCLGLLKKLLRYGIKVILLDHHETKMSYDDYAELENLFVINTMLESESCELSAGALCYCVIGRLLNRLGIPERGLSIYALISLYADCMNMHDALNRAIYFRATSIDASYVPDVVTMFMNQYQVLCSRFINFWFSPRVNALFRSENLGLINQLFLDENLSTVELSRTLAEVEHIYESVRELVINVSDVIHVSEMDNIVIADLSSAQPYVDIAAHKLWNYTGLVANKIGDRYSKAAFVYCPNGNSVKGSVRDIFGRDFLSPFSQLCRAEGHKPAFGTSIQLLDLDNFIENLARLDKKLNFTTISNKPIIIQYKYNEPDESLIEDIALINEFASPGVPIILIKKQRLGAMREIKTEYNFKYQWGSYYAQSQFSIPFGNWMLLRPTKGKSTKLIVQ